MLFCGNRYCGDHNELLIFKFENFKIGRYVSVTVIDSQNDDRLVSSRRSDKTSERRRLFGQNTWIVRGERLWAQNKHILDKLEKYNIPRNLWQALDNNWPLAESFPEVKEQLTKQNYRKKFHTLLFLEECENQKNLQNFEMHGITLQRDGRFFAITVPGLAEGRPSLIMGDKVLIKDENQKPEERQIIFEGFVHEVKAFH